MNRRRLFLVSSLAVCAFGCGLVAAMLGGPTPVAQGDNCDPNVIPDCPTSGGSSGGGGGVTSTPVVGSTRPALTRHVNRPPGPVTALRATAKVVGVVTLSWRLPVASDLAAVDVQRAMGARCPRAERWGTRIGATALRRVQVDRSVTPGAVYCYAVFVSDRAGLVSVAAFSKFVKAAPQPPPLAPANVTFTATTRMVTLRWTPSQEAGSYVVRRGAAGACPASSSAGTPIPTTTVGVATDSPPPSTVGYCYSVFAHTGGGWSKAASTARPVTLEALAVRQSPAKSSSGMVSSTLARVVAGVAGAALVLALLVFGIARYGPRLRGERWEYAPRGRMRLALERYDTSALVIPAALLLLGVGLLALAAITL
jgi:hypothetical protein